MKSWLISEQVAGPNLLTWHLELGGVPEVRSGFQAVAPPPGINAWASQKEPPEGDSISRVHPAVLLSPGIDARAGVRDR